MQKSQVWGGSEILSSRSRGDHGLQHLHVAPGEEGKASTLCPEWAGSTQTACFFTFLPKSCVANDNTEKNISRFKRTKMEVHDHLQEGLEETMEGNPVSGHREERRLDCHCV